MSADAERSSQGRTHTNFPFFEFTFSSGLGPVTPSGYEIQPKSSIILAVAKAEGGTTTTFFVTLESWRGRAGGFVTEVLTDECSSRQLRES